MCRGLRESDSSAYGIIYYYYGPFRVPLLIYSYYPCKVVITSQIGNYSNIPNM